MVDPLRSQLVDAVVDHERLRKGQRHSFQYRVFYAFVDIDELPNLDQSLWTFSSRGRSLYSLGAKDFISFGQADIKTNLQRWLKEKGHDVAVKKVWVFAHLRTLGFNFNPLSVFFCRNRSRNSLSR